MIRSIKIVQLVKRFKGFASDSMWQLVQNGLTLSVVIVSFVLLQYALGSNGESADGAVEYAPYAIIYAVLGPIGGLTWSGAGLSAFQRIKQYGDDHNETFRLYFSLYLFVAFVTASLSVVIISSIVKDALPVLTIICYVFSELFGRAIILICSWFIQSQKTFGYATRIRIGLDIIRLVAFIGLTLAGQLTLTTISYSLFVGYTIYALIILTQIMPHVGFTLSLGRFNRKVAKDTFNFALPMGAAMLQADGDKVFLGIFSDSSKGLDAEVGLYTAAYRVANLGLMPVRTLDAAAFPRFLKRKNEKNYYLKRSFYFASFLFLVGLVIAVFLLLARPLLGVFFESDFDSAIEMLPWLLPLIPLSALSGTPMNGLLGLQKNFQRSMVYLSSSFFSVVLYVTLIPSNGWKGAATATIISESYLALASWLTMVYYQKQENKSSIEAENLELTKS